MKYIYFILFFFFSVLTSFSISWALSECPSLGYRNNCFGTFVWDGGTKYIGEWKRDKMHGMGTYISADGDKYVGEWRDDKYNGQGTYLFLASSKFKGDKYFGEFKNGNYNGQGTYLHANGDKYIGEFKDSKRNGQGTFTWSDGRKDVGEFKNDKLNGYAIQYNADGTILKEGIFKDDVFQYAQKKPSNGINSNSKLSKYKEFCEDIGFKPGTEKFADCVFITMEKD